MAIGNNVVVANAYPTTAVSVGVTETPLAPVSNDRVECLLYNNGSATVFIGGSGVAVATGFPLVAGAYATIIGQAAISGIVAAGTEEVRVMRVERT